MKRGQPQTSPCSATTAASGASCRQRSNRPRAAVLLQASNGSSSAASAGDAAAMDKRPMKRARRGKLISSPPAGVSLFRVALVDQDGRVGVLLELQDAQA